MKTNRILLCATVSSDGGAERVMAHLANYFCKKNFDVTYAVMQDKGFYPMDASIKKVVFGKNTANGIEDILAIRKYLRTHDFENIVAFGYSVAIKMSIATLGLTCHKNITMSERNDPAHNAPSKVKAFLRTWAYGQSKRMVFQTEEARDFFNLKIRNKGVIIPNPLILPEIESESSKDKYRVIAAGRVTSQKNFTMLLEAFKEFYNTHPKYRLDIFGDLGDTKYVSVINELRRQLNIENSVHLCGFSKNILNEFASSGIYVSSSDYEGISNSMLEAMSCGLPVICTDCPCGGARLAIENNVNGILTPVNDSKAMAAALGKIADDEIFALEIGRKAKDVTEKFSLTSIAEQWINVFQT